MRLLPIIVLGIIADNFIKKIIIKIKPTFNNSVQQTDDALNKIIFFNDNHFFSLNMKNLLFILAAMFLALTFNSNVMAQAAKGKGDDKKRTPESVAQKTTDRLTKALGLSADQKTKVYNLTLKSATQVKDIRTKNKGNKDAIRADIAKVKEASRAELKNILTAEQFKKWTEIRKKHDNKKGGGKAKSKGKAGGSSDDDEDDLF